MFGVIGQNLLNMLRPDKKVEVLHHGRQGIIRLGGGEKKRCKFWGNLSWHLYLMDLIKKGKKKKINRQEMQENIYFQ